MDSKTLVIGLVFGLILGAGVAYVAVPEKTTIEYISQDSGLSLAEYNTLQTENSELEQNYYSLQTRYNSLESNKASLENQVLILQDQVEALETELEKSIPPEMGSLGKSRSNPADINTTLHIEFIVSGENGFSGKMTVTDVIRGEPALQKVIEADGYLRDLFYEVEKWLGLMQEYNRTFGSDSVYFLDAQDHYTQAVNRLDRNFPLDDGYEFLCIKIKFTFVDGPKSIALSPLDFKVLSDSGIIYDIPNVETPSPLFDVEMIPNSEFEGWCVYEVLSDDEHSMISFASGSDFIGGLWFKLFF